MTRDEAVRCFCNWFDDGCVGNIMFYRSPRANNVDCVVEETIKLREFEAAERGDVERVFNVLQAERIELYRNGTGEPDRVKVIRRG
jgi:hypothetical protein